MKKSTLFLLLSCLLTFATCKKVEHNVADYYPQVQTLSVSIRGDGSAIVTGQITKTGDKGIQFAGFCMDTIPNPDMITNQIIVDTITGDMFTGRYTSFNPLKKYYFRAWVANENGYALGNVISADSIVFNSSFVPCSMSANKMFLNWGQGVDSEAYTSVSGLPNNTTGPTLYANTGNHSITMQFNNYPVTKVYKTSYSGSPTGNDDVGMLFDNFIAQGAADVYVKQISPTAFEITICSDSVYSNSGSFVLSTKFVSGQ